MKHGGEFRLTSVGAARDEKASWVPQTSVGSTKCFICSFPLKTTVMKEGGDLNVVMKEWYLCGVYDKARSNGSTEGEPCRDPGIAVSLEPSSHS